MNEMLTIHPYTYTYVYIPTHTYMYVRIFTLTHIYLQFELVLFFPADYWIIPILYSLKSTR